MEYNLRISLIILLFLVLIPSSLSTNLESIEAITPASTYLNISNNLFVSSSNVGIGTSSPGQKLDVSGGNIRTTGQLISTVATGTAPLSVSSTTKVTNLNADLLDGHDTSYFMTASTDNWVNVAGDTMTGPLVMSSTYLNLNRAGAADTGIQWYSNSYNAWAEYMAPTGAGMGPKGTLTAPSGSIVTSWALRSFIENVGGYGWTWESGTSSTTTPNVVAEIRASDGLAQFDGGVRSPIFYDLDNTGYYVDPASTGNSVLAAGKVGIGTTSPQTKTHIWSGEVASGQQEVLRLEGNWITTGDGPLLRFTNQHDSGTTPNSGEYNLAGIQARDFAANWAGGLVFMTPNAGTSGGSALVDRMVIREGGNVGIGTTSPTNKLDVVGVIQVTPTVGTQKFGLYSYNNVFQLNPRNSDGSYASITGLTMDSSGNVGIDTSSPAQKLHVAGNTYVTGYLGVGSSNPVKTLDVRGDAYISGNVGIGTSDPGVKLDVTGDIRTSNALVFKDPHGTTDIYRTISASIDHVDAANTALYAIIIHPTSATNPADMLSMRLHGYNYDSDFNMVDVRINGYLYSNGGLSHNQGWKNYGTTPVDSVKSYKRDSDGRSATVVTFGRLLDYPQLTLDVLAGYAAGVAEADDWDLIITNDLTGYTYVSTVTERQIYEAYSSHIWRIDQNEKMRIDSNGNVGIGTTAPADKLDVNGDVRVRGGDIKDSGGTARITFSGTNVIIRVG